MTEAIARALPEPLAPGLPVFSGQTRLLVVAPHPDDETIATGLLIQQVKEAGGEVQILLLTAGDNNPWPQRWLERRVLEDSRGLHQLLLRDSMGLEGQILPPQLIDQLL